MSRQSTADTVTCCCNSAIACRRLNHTERNRTVRRVISVFLTALDGTNLAWLATRVYLEHKIQYIAQEKKNLGTRKKPRVLTRASSQVAKSFVCVRARGKDPQHPTSSGKGGMRGRLVQPFLLGYTLVCS